VLRAALLDLAPTRNWFTSWHVDNPPLIKT
jgi:hypothetical protein